MKKFFLFFALFFLIIFAQAQTIKRAQIRLSADGKEIRFMELILNNGYAVGINDCRDIAYLKSERHKVPVDDYLGKDMEVKYYGNYDIHDPAGKIKSIGDIVFKYNNAFDIHEVYGTLKSVGGIDIKYNNVFDINAVKGSIKSVGKVQLSYYDKFGPEERLGEIRSIIGNSGFLSVHAPSRRRYFY